MGGILSSVLNDYAIPLNVWIEDNKICEFTNAVLSLWRDHGERSARPKGRFRLYLNKIGIENFRDLVEERFGKLKTDPGSDFCKIPRSFLGINQQKQKDIFFAGLHVPVGRLSSEDLQDIALLSENYGSGDIRLTEDQNIIITNIPKDKLEEFKKENLLDKFPLNPGHLSAGTVSCTGNTYCNFALTNTKDTALEVSQLLDQELDLDDEIKIHWTGCPNSCGQAYMGAIGLTGKKGRDSEGKIVDAYDICIGGEQGPSNKIGKIHLKKVPKYEIKNTLKQILIENFSAKEKLIKMATLSEKEIRDRFNQKNIPKDPLWIEQAYSKSLPYEIRHLLCERLGFLAEKGWASIKSLIKKHGGQPELIYAVGICHQIEARDFLLNQLDEQKDLDINILKALACWGAVLNNSQLELILKSKSQAIRIAGLELLSFKSHLLHETELLELVNEPLKDFRDEVVIKGIKILQRRNEDAVIDRLKQLALNGSYPIAEQALIALGSIGTKYSSRQISELVTQLDIKELQQKAKSNYLFKIYFGSNK